MSRFKHILMGSVLAAALIAVPVVPALAQTAHAPTTATAAQISGMPCAGCWS